ncbi:hypothetical protein Bmyc01_49160 [Bacillus mycoides]|nr:hypothetical protein Bmyc01_49160 [Bacillus mycoides]
MKELKNQNDKKNKSVGKTGEISNKFPWENREEFREISEKKFVSQDGFIKAFL